MASPGGKRKKSNQACRQGRSGLGRRSFRSYLKKKKNVGAPGRRTILKAFWGEKVREDAREVGA